MAQHVTICKVMLIGDDVMAVKTTAIIGKFETAVIVT